MLDTAQRPPTNQTESSLYSLPELLALLAFSILLSLVTYLLLPSTLRSGERYWYIGSLVDFAAVDAFVLLQKPSIWRMSRWSVSPKDAGLAIATGCALSLLIRLYFHDSPDLSIASVTDAVCLMPVIEELFFRGIVLRSLILRFPSWIAVLLVSGPTTLGLCRGFCSAGDLRPRLHETR